MKKTTIAAMAFTFTFTTSVFAADSVCETYAAMTDAAKVVKTVEPVKGKLTRVELGMIQSTIMTQNPGEPMTPQQALNEFADVEHDGSNGGSIVYLQVPYRGKKLLLAQVTFYPGDNQYGSLFLMNKNYADAIGTIEDGDVVCKKYQ